MIKLFSFSLALIFTSLSWASETSTADTQEMISPQPQTMTNRTINMGQNNWQSISDLEKDLVDIKEEAQKLITYHVFCKEVLSKQDQIMEILRHLQKLCCAANSDSIETSQRHQLYWEFRPLVDSFRIIFNVHTLSKVFPLMGDFPEEITLTGNEIFIIPTFKPLYDQLIPLSVLTCEEAAKSQTVINDVMQKTATQFQSIAEQKNTVDMLLMENNQQHDRKASLMKVSLSHQKEIVDKINALIFPDAS